MFIGVTERIERDFAQVDLVWNFDRFEVGYFAQNRLKNAEIFFSPVVIYRLAKIKAFYHVDKEYTP